MSFREAWPDFTEQNVRRSLDEFARAATNMFGCNAPAARIGITGAIELDMLDGPVVYVALTGRFWHRRETVLRNAEAFLRQRFPELAEVCVMSDDMLVDVEFDEEGNVLLDKRAPDYNGDRQALEYQGIDPDTRGPFR